MRRFPLYHVDAFAAAPFSGNPAAVVLEDPARGPELSDEERQQGIQAFPRPRASLARVYGTAACAVASELNLSETAFVAPDGAKNVRCRRHRPPQARLP